MEHLALYNALIHDMNALNDFVDTLSHDEKKALRMALEASGSQYLIKPLYYDYNLQQWID